MEVEEVDTDSDGKVVYVEIWRRQRHTADNCGILSESRKICDEVVARVGPKL